ncbi:MAG: single-stranded DNA-binding protein, partial [Saprospiraceae bacterium]
KTAKYMGELLRKGNEVAIQGKLAYRSYEDKDGVKQYITEVVVQEFVKLTKRAQQENVEEVATVQA